MCEPANNIKMKKFTTMKETERPTGSERTVMSTVLRNMPIARADITKLTNLSQQSVHRIVDNLAERDLLRLDDPYISGRGKPSPRVKIETKRFISIGISIGTEEAKVCAMDLAGQPIHQDILKVDPGEPRKLITAFEAKIAQWLNEELSQNQILGLGIAMQGHRVDRQGIFVAPSPLAKWANYPLAKEFSSHFELPVFAENNATCSATAEFYLGAGAGSDPHCLAYLSFNYGYGAGLFVERDAFLGGHGNAGEISTIFTPEQANKRPALGELVKRLNKASYSISNIRTLIESIEPSNPVISNWLDEIKPQLCLSIRALKAVADPNEIVFGGEAPSYLRERLVETAAEAFKGQLTPNPILRVSDIPFDPAHIGAALLPLHKLIY
jgi:predicted NBD/HSP70 family sugar kinase